MKNIIQQLGTQEFARVRVGVGAKPKGWDLADYVMGRFDSTDRKKIEEAMEHAMAAAVMMMEGDVDKAMNAYNTKKREE